MRVRNRIALKGNAMKISHFDWSNLLLFLIICVCLVFVYVASAPVHAEPILTAPAGSFIVKGNTREGFYSRITAPGFELRLKRNRHFNQVGGLGIETNPSYDISGKSPAGTVTLAVTLEDIVDRSGPVAVQTGEIVHVKGTLGDQTLALDIHERRKIDDLGSISVEFDTWKELSSPDRQFFATMRRIVDTDRTGGLVIERGSHYSFTGKDREAPFEFTIRESKDEESADQVLLLSGSLSPLATTLSLALRPFLRP
jgi:hypothetical protein